MAEYTGNDASFHPSGKTLSKEKTRLTKSVTKKNRKNKKIAAGIGASIVALLIIILPIIIMKLKKAPLKEPLKDPSGKPVTPVPKFFGIVDGPIPQTWFTAHKDIEIPDSAIEEIKKLGLTTDTPTEKFFQKHLDQNGKKLFLMSYILGAANEMEGAFEGTFKDEQMAILNKMAKWVQDPPEKVEDLYIAAGFYIQSVHELIIMEKKFQHKQNLVLEDFKVQRNHFLHSFANAFKTFERFPENPYAKSAEIVYDAIHTTSCSDVILNIVVEHSSVMQKYKDRKFYSKRYSGEENFIEKARQEVLQNSEFKGDGLSGIMFEAWLSLMNKYK